MAPIHDDAMTAPPPPPPSPDAAETPDATDPPSPPQFIPSPTTSTLALLAAGSGCPSAPPPPHTPAPLAASDDEAEAASPPAPLAATNDEAVEGMGAFSYTKRHSWFSMCMHAGFLVIHRMNLAVCVGDRIFCTCLFYVLVCWTDRDREREMLGGWPFGSHVCMWKSVYGRSRIAKSSAHSISVNNPFPFFNQTNPGLNTHLQQLLVQAGILVVDQGPQVGQHSRRHLPHVPLSRCQFCILLINGG